MSPTPRIPMPFGHPFTRDDAEARGLSYQVIRGWLLRGECARLSRGLYAPSHLAQSNEIRSIWASQAVARGDVAVSAYGAALLHNLPVPRRLPAYARSPIALTDLPTDCRHRFGTLMAPTLEWTSILIARGQALGGSLIPLDAAVRRGIQPEQLLDLLRRTERWPGIAGMATAIREANPASESPLESASRGWFRQHGLPRPVLQQQFGVAGANYFVDFYWAHAGLIGEADGLAKYENAQELRRERARQSALDSTGSRVIRWGWQDLEQRPELLLRTLRYALG